MISNNYWSLVATWDDEFSVKYFGLGIKNITFKAMFICFLQPGQSGNYTLKPLSRGLGICEKSLLQTSDKLCTNDVASLVHLHNTF